MESLFCYKSDDDTEDDPCKVKDTAEPTDGSVMELDVNYDSVTMEMSEDSSSDPTVNREEGEKVENVGTVPLLSSPSPSSSSSLSSSSSASSSTASGDIKQKYRLKKVDLKRTRKNRSPNTRKSYDHESSSINEKSYSRHDETGRDKRNLESARHEDRKRDKNKESDSSKAVKKRSSRSPRRRERSHHHQNRRSRSPVYKRRSSSRHRSYASSTYRYSRERDRDRESSGKKHSNSRSRGRSSKKPSKLTILGRLGIELKVPEGSPQMTLQKSMQEQVAKVKDATGIALPSYYNPVAVNPSKYAEQMQKRKLLWGGGAKVNPTTVAENKEESEDKNKSVSSGPASLWQGATFSQDQDGKLTAKFKRLMGIKNIDERQQATATSSTSTSTSVPTGVDLIKKQEEMFNSMEMQYEVARVATHTHRGLGLGFGLHQYPR